MVLQEPSAHLEGIFFRDFSNSYIPQILQEVYIQKLYHPFLSGKNDAIILDIGQNIGLTSYYFKDFAKQVIGLEPSAQHREASTTMIKQNKIENIKVLPYALSNKNGKEKFYHNTNSTMFSLESTVNDSSNYEEVETITFDELFKRENLTTVDFCKLDVEGHESQILASDGFKTVAPHIKAMVMEWHAWTASSLPNTIHLLTQLGFEVRRIPSDATILSAVRI